MNRTIQQEMRARTRRKNEKLSPELAEQIRSITGRSGQSIADQFGVSPVLVSMVRRNLVWPA